MQATIVLSLASLVYSCFGSPVEYYHFDLGNVEKKFAEPESLKNYSNCFLDRGPCTQLGGEIKKVIAHSIVTHCDQCSPAQKHAAERFMEEITKHYPEDFISFHKKYDPEYKNFEKFLEAIRDA